MRVRDAQQLANTFLGIERDPSFICHDSQKDIQQGFRVMQTFQEALADETMFNPTETAVTAPETIGTQNGDIGSHVPTVGQGWPSGPSRFALFTPITFK